MWFHYLLPTLLFPLIAQSPPAATRNRHGVAADEQVVVSKPQEPILLAAVVTKKLRAKQVVVRVQKFYRRIKKLEAKFKQTYTNSVFGRKSNSEGKLYLAKPGKMRWDYMRPEKKFFISDGKILWAYEKKKKQAFKQNLKDQLLPVAVTFLYGKGQLSKDFRASLDPGKFGGKNDIVVKLVPRKPSAQFKNLWLVVDKNDFHVKESIIKEASDNLNHFKFWDITLNANTKIKDSLFQFVPPKGIKVILPGNGDQN